VSFSLKVSVFGLGITANIMAAILFASVGFFQAKFPEHHPEFTLSIVLFAPQVIG
jgi:hypothetical protein